MSEKIVHENIEPILKDLDGRVARLEKSLKLDINKVEDFTRDKPVEALGITLLIGAGLGLLLGISIAKAKD
jgi:ElaB/YqjD/DUF883 family membrane-anchored ribosome-binding protein